MEYDPASPTDEVEDYSAAVDLSTIPLPEPLGIVGNSIDDLIDIPLPPVDLVAADIPLPPPSLPEPAICQPEDTQTTVQPDVPDSDVVPLKFSLRISAKPLGQETTGESTGIFESNKESKVEEHRSMPRLQALMKRSKPSQLPVGVLPSKIKLPATETKTELFLPTKESDMNGVQSFTDSMKVSVSNPLTNPPFSTHQDVNGNLSKDSAAFSSNASLTTDAHMHNDATAVSSMGSAVNMSNILTSIANTHIPNLMSLTVQPVQSLNLAQSANSLTTDPSAVLRQTKMTLANMQYVNPQKLRSAQMIATPLIANPAIAAQPHHDDQSKSRERRRSRSRRSRSGRRSSPARRGRRRRSSSSSDSSPPRRSPRRYQRRSRSRRSSPDRYSRSAYSRNRGRDRRDFERRRERLNESDSKRSHRDERVEKRHSSRTSPPKDSKRLRRRSSSHGHSERSKLSRKTPDRRESNRDRNEVKKRDDSKSRLNRDASCRKHSRSPQTKSNSSADKKVASTGSTTSAAHEKVHSDVQVKSLDQRRVSQSSESGSESSTTSSGSIEPTVKANRNSEVAQEDVGSSSSKRRKVSEGESDSSSEESGSSSSHSEHSEISSPLERTGEAEMEPSEAKPALSIANAETDIGVSSADPGCSAAVPSPGCFEKNPDATSGSVDASVPPLVGACVSDEFASSTGRPPTDAYDGDCSVVHPSENLDAEQRSLTFTPGQTSSDSLGDTSAPSSVSSAHSVTLKEAASPALQRRCDAKYDLRERKTKQNMEVHEQLQALLSAMHAGLSSPKSPSRVFDAFPEAPRPQYIHILINDYSHVEEDSSRSNSCLPSLLGSAGNQTREMRRWICDCVMPSLEELNMGMFACGPGCINRSLNIECGPSCPAGHFCSNRQFQDRLYASVEPFYAGPCVGWGLRATAPIMKNCFVIEYVGEVIDFAEFRRRVRRYERIGHTHHYFMALETDRFIDAGTKGNWARFVNHSCEPNCDTQKWSVDGKIRIGFFALKDIPTGAELTIDYQFVQFGASEQKCYCGAPSCSGIMGSTNKTLQEKIRLKDTSMVERRVIQLLERSSFEDADDITLLLQVLVQECLTRYTRLELLQRLSVTESAACLKLFRQYNGLDMLGALMCDSEPNDWELKQLILVCLDRIPVSEQKQLQSNSRLLDIVTQWTIDPHHCRPRIAPAETEQSALIISRNQSHGVEPTTNVVDESTFQVAATPDPITDSIPNSVISGDLAASSESSVMDDKCTLCSVDVPAPAAPPMDADITQPALMPAYVQGDDVTITVSQRSQSEWIQDIRNLAIKLIEKWSKLPFENYRIPRTERQETEKELHLFNHTTSSLISWGHIENEDSAFSSWTQTNGTKSNTVLTANDRSRRAHQDGASDSPSSCYVFADSSLRILTKSERRKLFEARVHAAEVKKQKQVGEVEKAHIKSESDNTEFSSANRARIADGENVRHLLLLLLLNELNISGLSLDQLALPGLDSKNAAKSLQALLQALPDMLSKFPVFKDLSTLTPLIDRLCKELAVHTAKPASPLPSGWQSARDPSGRIYYYNMESKIVQREHPAGKKVSDDEPSLIDSLICVNAADRAKAEKAFTVEVGNFVLRLLKPYRLPNCLTGRIESSSDLVHITRKLTHAFVSKALKQLLPTQMPAMTPSLQDHIRSSLTRYMTSRGAVYKRRKKTTSSLVRTSVSGR